MLYPMSNVNNPFLTSDMDMDQMWLKDDLDTYLVFIQLGHGWDIFKIDT